MGAAVCHGSVPFEWFLSIQTPNAWDAQPMSKVGKHGPHPGVNDAYRPLFLVGGKERAGPSPFAEWSVVSCFFLRRQLVCLARRTDDTHEVGMHSCQAFIRTPHSRKVVSNSSAYKRYWVKDAVIKETLRRQSAKPRCYFWKIDGPGRCLNQQINQGPLCFHQTQQKGHLCCQI